MCGIVGTMVFARSDYRVEDSYLTRMRDTMVHRGPDGGANWIAPDGRLGLGHRRLAIIDLSAQADQPMCNEDGSLWVVFNGEIYNHAEIRTELQQLGGHTWKTDHSDTEVILHAFEQWGIDCVQRFRGMFAMALWDVRARALWLIRDRVGIKPLYYSMHDGRLVFASEIKALLRDPAQQRRLDEEALFHYLSFLTTPAPQTLFEGIRKLPCGSYLRVTPDGQIHEVRYWDPWDHTTPLLGVPEAEVAQRICAELRTAVKLRKISDVPVGVFLSGGIDSSTNAVLFSEGEGRPIHTFSIGYEGDNPSYGDELPYARRVAAMVGAEHHELRLKLDDLLSFLPRMIELQDEPIGDPVCVPIYFVSQLARQHGVIVCQVGEGADELFCGYPGWQRAIQLQRWGGAPVPRLARRVALAAVRGLSGDHTQTYEYLRRSVAGQPMFWGGAEAFTQAEKLRLLSPRLRARFARTSSWAVIEPIRKRFEAKAWDTSALHWMTYLDLNLRLPELLLMRVDKMSMGMSLEGRVPFLDHRFVELALSIPTELKTKHGELKYLLKKAVRGLIPDEIIDRKKQGFGIPIREWFIDRLGAVTRSHLQEFCQQTDYLDAAAVDAVIDSGRGSQAWYLLNLALWWKKYVA